MLITGAVVLVVVAVLVVALVAGRSPSTVALVDPAEPAPAALASGHTLGRADASVTIDLWEDFQCPNCAVFARTVEPRLVNQYVVPGTARIVFHHLAFIGSTANRDGFESLLAAVAADCASDQGRFWAYQEYLFANQGPQENGGTFNAELFDAIARRLGLDVTAFDSCRADPARAASVKAARAEATAAGITGTPTIHVNGTAVAAWNFPTVSAAIEAAAASAPPAASSAAGSVPPASTPPGPTAPAP